MCDILAQGALCLSEKDAHLNQCPSLLSWLWEISLLGSNQPPKYTFLLNVCDKAGTGWQIHTVIAPMPFCGTAAICVTLALADYQPCKYNPQNFGIALTELLVLFFVFVSQSSTACQYSTQAEWCFGPCKSIFKWHLKRSEVWEQGHVVVRIDLPFD